MWKNRALRTRLPKQQIALPKPERPLRVNAINKFCKHCKKIGHSRDECWHLNGQPGFNIKSPEQRKKPRKESENDRKEPRQRKRDSESVSSDSEEDTRKKQSRSAVEYRVTLISTISYTRVLSQNC